MEFIKENDIYFQVKEREVEATLYVRNESGDVEEITGFNIEYNREEVSEDVVLNTYHNSISEMNKLFIEVENKENELEVLESNYKLKKEEVSKFENILPSELHAVDEDVEDSDNE